MEDIFEALIENVGEVTHQQDAKLASIEKYSGVLPQSLLSFWEKYGWCGFGNGLLWIVDPSDYQEELKAWIGDTDIVNWDTYHVIARSGFGDLYLWGNKTGNMFQVTTSHGWVMILENKKEDIAEEGVDSVLELVLGSYCRETIDLPDLDTREPLFNRAVEKLGPLGPDEIFGFSPALFMGGKLGLDGMTKVDVHDHALNLSQFGYREILDQDDLFIRAFG